MFLAGLTIKDMDFINKRILAILFFSRINMWYRFIFQILNLPLLG